MIEIPKNCIECEYNQDCQRYYGARSCKYEKEIIEAILTGRYKYKLKE